MSLALGWLARPLRVPQGARPLLRRFLSSSLLQATIPFATPDGTESVVKQSSNTSSLTTRPPGQKRKRRTKEEVQAQREAGQALKEERRVAREAKAALRAANAVVPARRGHTSSSNIPFISNIPPEYAKFPPLPPLNTWRDTFPRLQQVRDRISLRNPLSSMQVAQAFVGSDWSDSGKPKTVVEAFPGPGALSRGLLTLPPSKLGKLIILEDYEPYLEYLRPLELVDPRVKVVPLSGFTWDTYRVLEDERILDPETIDWNDGIHPSLQFIIHIPQSISGEQFVAQLLRCIPERSWLFKYGRVPMSFLLSDWVWRRVSANVDATERCKLSVIAEATADIRLALPSELLQPFDDHFHPTRTAYNQLADTRKPEARRLGTPYVAATIVPHQTQLIDKGMLDKWDYILRRLFVQKSTPLRKSISSLAPGAEVLLKTLTDPSLPPEQQVDVRQRNRDLSVADWALLFRAFHAWPFAPEDLAIDSFLSEDDRAYR
ncbi:S-adenosyl-L-methionine-dependent methyltransferase [Amylostereum chailletii]|nr:S-adenosyl-L-methionine-dependent methyltransferase [Amylostereum chailletii]